jgi:hypothetical protein
MIWLVILVALAIPLAAVILDSPVMRSWVGRRGASEGEVHSGADMKVLAEKVETLEHELEVATHEIAQLKESHQFFQRLLEDPAARQAAAKLPKPPA